MLDALISANMLAGPPIFEHDDVEYYEFLAAHTALDAIDAGEGRG
ncbi:MAG: hypothetical protein ACRD2C_28245 [Acidimicrobiales bacterium]